MKLRLATVEDVDALVSLRVEFMNDIRGYVPTKEFLEATRACLVRDIPTQQLLYALAEEDGQIAATMTLCVQQRMPSPRSADGRFGYLMNVYTKPEFRRRGLCVQLLDFTMEKARGIGIREVFLDYTDVGKLVYEKYGFKPCDRDMVYEIPQA